MKTRCLLCSSVIVSFLVVFSSIGFAQSSQCTIVAKQGSLVTATCPGQGTQIVNLGGSADTYKVGDTITLNSTKQENKVRDVRPKIQ
jgi:hypothetical protein